MLLILLLLLRQTKVHEHVLVSERQRPGGGRWARHVKALVLLYHTLADDLHHVLKSPTRASLLGWLPPLALRRRALAPSVELIYGTRVLFTICACYAPNRLGSWYIFEVKKIWAPTRPDAYII